MNKDARAALCVVSGLVILPVASAACIKFMNPNSATVLEIAIFQSMPFAWAALAGIGISAWTRGRFIRWAPIWLLQSALAAAAVALLAAALPHLLLSNNGHHEGRVLTGLELATVVFAVAIPIYPDAPHRRSAA